MSASDLITRLSKARKTGSGRWLACCPAHEDKTPSLAVTEADDGRVLVHCFGGCSVENILAAVGLEFDALFPEKAINDTYAKRRIRFNARDVLKAVSHELTICKIILGDITKGEPISDDDLRRFLTAAERVEEARRYATL